MGIFDWANGIRSAIRSEGIRRGISTALYELRVGIVRRLAERSHDPEYIWDRDWDVLVVLDACRLDMIRDAADSYDYIGEIDTHTSAATSTTEWSRRNFAPDFAEELSETAYITANPNSITIGDIDLRPECPCGSPLPHDGRTLTVTCPSCGEQVTGKRRHPFKYFEELWREHWDEDLGTLPPDVVTSKAIEVMRNKDHERLIVHYNQPHHPFIVSDGTNVETKFDLSGDENVWNELRIGSVSEREVWEAYTSNLEYVLKALPTLLENIDANTVAITSDHGNAVGEWGIYGHPNPPVPIQSLVEVPWIETQARNIRKDDPDAIGHDTKSGTISDDVGDRLRDLGYV